MSEANEHGERKKKPWMKAAAFKAFHGPRLSEDGGQSVSTDPDAPAAEAASSCFKDVTFDVPAWVEAMHRTKRKRTLCYVVRSRGGEGGDDTVSLRTGNDFTKVFQIREEKVRASETQPTEVSI